MRFTALSWNLYHGRDFPPDPSLFTWRSRLLRVTERNATHAQVNRDLRREFAGLLARSAWDVALLQECPPRFAAELARACGADSHRVLTSRNSLGALRGAAARLNPDLIASAEGGSNLTLVRSGGALGGIVERRDVTIHDGPHERRAMALSRTRAGACVANLHATANHPDAAAEDVMRAVAAAVAWADGRPLLFGGDLNLRPAESPSVFHRLQDRFDLGGPTAPDAIDHLLARGLTAAAPPTRWAPERREVPFEDVDAEDGGQGSPRSPHPPLMVRLSDHPPVEATFAASSVGNVGS